MRPGELRYRKPADPNLYGDPGRSRTSIPIQQVPITSQLYNGMTWDQATATINTALSKIEILEKRIEEIESTIGLALENPLPLDDDA